MNEPIKSPEDLPVEAANSVPDRIVISDLDTFVRAIYHWHGTKMKTLAHMQSIPDGSAVQVGDGEKISLTGELMAGFQLGLDIALMELSELPFTTDIEDAPVPATH